MRFEYTLSTLTKIIAIQKGVIHMKVKVSYSDLDDRKYIGRVLGVFGLFAAGAALNVAWPALAHIGSKLVG